MNKFWRFIGFILLLTCGQLYAAQPVPVVDQPDWVIDRKYNVDSQVPHHAIKKGVYFLLVDTQLKVSPSGNRERFYHFAEHIVNQSGIEESSQLNISFDPAYQKLSLNSLLVWRDGQRIDKTTTAKMALLQREEELESLIYNGKQTLNIILDDIRTGDIIEYSYTQAGANPIFQGIFSYGRYLQWSVPVDSLHFRLVWEKPTPLHHKLYNSQLTLNEEITPDGHIYWLQQNHVEALETSANTPSWFDPYSFIQFSELGNWNEVVQWGMPLYETAIQSSDSIQAIAAEVRAGNTDADDQIAAALQYVQREVRYLGIEFGENSHKPSAAEETLKRRYGDCKDKAVLLISLLRELDIEAYPALVNTDLKQELINLLPSISNFDHVIVQVRHNNKSYWLDPTRQYQYGRLKDIYQPYYDYALVINPAEKSLTPIQPDQVDSFYSVKDSFDLTSTNRNEVIFTSEAEYYGLNAERQRAHLATDGLTKTQADYLGFFKGYYPSIKTIEPFSYTDNPSQNKLYGHEKYSIEDFWVMNEAETKYDADFYANAISSYLDEPDLTAPNEPVSISYPVNIRQTIEATFNSDGWDFSTDTFVEDNEFFYFTSHVEFDPAQRRLTLNYEYKSKAAYVPADKISGYLAALDRASDNLGYAIYESITSPAPASEETPINWAYVGITIYVTLFLLAVFLWLYDSRRHPFNGETTYYPVSPVKLISMWILTFGLYSLYWFYKNWLYVKSRDSLSIMPAARGFFNHFWYYPLYTELHNDNTTRFEQRHLPGKTIAIICAIGYLLLGIFASKSSFTILSMFLSALLILPMANYINFINDNNAAYVHNSRWKFRHSLLALVTTPLLLLSMGSELGLTPSDAVISGDNVLSHNIKFMQRKGILDADDNLVYFYSDALLDIRDDGNAFTDRHVFSYWKDDDGAFNFETARFDEIKDIKTTWSKSWHDDTVIDIVRHDDSKFILFISNTGKKDKVFVQALMDRWKQNAI